MAGLVHLSRLDWISWLLISNRRLYCRYTGMDLELLRINQYARNWSRNARCIFLFQPPKPANAWDGVRFAKTDAEICTQRNIYIHQEEIVGGEDCLYLNVYTPKVPDWDYGFHQFPVMIWFHGGGWVAGAGHFNYYGPKFLLDHDVILVTVNYRWWNLIHMVPSNWRKLLDWEPLDLAIKCFEFFHSHILFTVH